VKNILKIVRLSKPQHKLIFLACVLITVQAILQQLTPITFKFVVDELSAQISTGSGNYQKLTYLFGLILAINLVGVLLSTITQGLGE
jgi:ABC-type multidrug transport system fused ATPase/permease subunit